MHSPTLTRRAALLGALASSTALAVPAAAAVHAHEPVERPADLPADFVCHGYRATPEHPNDRVRRLAREIAATLRNPKFVGFDRVTITAQYVGYDENPATTAQKEMAAITRLIARHEKAWLAFDNSCPAADESDPRYGGAVAVARNRRLGAAEKRALHALLSEPVYEPGPRNKKASYLLTTMGGGGRWEPDVETVAALIGATI